ncbi:MAG: ABC transporter permease [Phycisphaerales bacterium]|jgi:putative ABC transport system permease protein|nr:ABC transporter permease [Phycisphaerales bacterium]
MTDASIIRRSLSSRWFSTLSTVLTVAVAVALMLVLLSMRDAGRRSLERGSGNMHLLVSADSSPLTSVLNAVFYARSPARAMPVTRAEALADNPLVQWALPVQQGDNYKGFPTLAVSPEFFRLFQPVPGEPWGIVGGSFPSLQADPSADDPDAHHFEVMLGAEAARGTGLGIGDRLVITHGTAGEAGHVHDDHPFTVVGILAPTQTAHDRAVFISLTATWIVHAADFRAAAGEKESPTAANLRASEKLITGIYVRARGRPSAAGAGEGGDAPASLPQLFAELRRDPTLTVASPSQQIGTLFRIVGNIDRLFVGVAAVVLVSSAVTIMLVMHAAMELRRRQIAILRVLGASKGRVFSLAMTEAAVLGLAGAMLGVALAVIGARITAEAVRSRVGLVIEPNIEPVWTLALLAGAVALACLAGLIPAWRAYRTDVLGSLRPLA